MSPCCIFAWTLAGMMATPPVEVERALRDAPSVTLDARVDASKITRLPPPGVPDRLTPPPPIVRRIADVQSADVRVGRSATLGGLEVTVTWPAAEVPDKT